MGKVSLKKVRTLKKTEKLQRRQNKYILQNQQDLVEEKHLRNKTYLDEGESSSDDEAPEEISYKKNPNGELNSEDDYEDNMLDNFLNEKKITKRKNKKSKKIVEQVEKGLSEEEIEDTTQYQQLKDQSLFGIKQGNSGIQFVNVKKCGPSKFLNPRGNFRDDLLRLSTRSLRVAKLSNTKHTEKWKHA